MRILVNDVLDGLGLVPDKDFKQIILDRAAQGPKRVLDGEARALWGAGTIPQLSEFLASLQIASVSGMIAPARCGWAPLWSERHSRSYDLSEEQVQTCMGKRGPG